MQWHLQPRDQKQAAAVVGRDASAAPTNGYDAGAYHGANGGSYGVQYGAPPQWGYDAASAAAAYAAYYGYYGYGGMYQQNGAEAMGNAREDMAGEGGQGGASYAGSVPRKVEYTPYTVEDFKEKPYNPKSGKAYWELGKNGPDLETDELREKREKAERMRQYAANAHRKNREAAASSPSKPKVLLWCPWRLLVPPSRAKH